jgi:DNA helicase IV
MVATASGELTRRAVDEVLEHTRVQFSKTTEAEYAHVVDRARLVAVDGRPLDRGTASGDARTIDTEDYAVLFELDRMRAELGGLAPTSPRAFDVLMVDEAQEFAPLELALLGRSLARGGSVIVAGDAAQQIDPSTTFLGWGGAMRELGVSSFESVELGVGYRCPPDVVAIAKQVLAGAPKGAADVRPSVARFADEPERAAWLAREVARIAAKDPRASVAILCRSELSARDVARWLRPLAPVRWVTDGRFRARGAQIAAIDQVKGLEFDHVVVADADATSFPDVPAARRALYVASTRARHEVVFLTLGPPSPLLDRSA